MSLRVIYEFVAGEFEQAMGGISFPIEEAAVAAITEAGDIVKREGRAQIASAGFSIKWQNALRVNIYRNRGLDAAAFIYHKIPYAGVFERGERIAGKPTLWVPLSSTPKKVGAKKMTAKLYSDEIGRLFPIRIKGKRFLASKVGLSKANARRAVPKLSNAMLRKGASGGGKGGSTRAIPLFVEALSVKMPDRLNIREITEATAARLGAIYAEALKAE